MLSNMSNVLFTIILIIRTVSCVLLTLLFRNQLTMPLTKHCYRWYFTKYISLDFCEYYCISYNRPGNSLSSMDIVNPVSCANLIALSSRGKCQSPESMSPCSMSRDVVLIGRRAIDALQGVRI